MDAKCPLRGSVLQANLHAIASMLAIIAPPKRVAATSMPIGTIPVAGMPINQKADRMETVIEPENPA